MTPRERAVLRGLGAGLSEEQIAEQEHVGHRTVERTVRELKRKLEAPTLAVLALRARNLGLLEQATL